MIRIDAQKRAFLRFTWLTNAIGPVCYMPLAVWREWCNRIRYRAHHDAEERVRELMRR